MMEAPSQVHRAVLLLYVSLALSALITIEGLAREFAAESMFGDLWMWAILSLGYFIYALLIQKVSRRRNWARMTIFVLTVAAGVGYPLVGYYLPEEGLSYWIPSMGITVLDLVALYLLFSGAGGKWYSSAAAA